MKVILNSAGVQLGSPLGMSNLGLCLYRGIEKKSRMNILLKSLEKGVLSPITKQIADQYFDENKEFRLKHPNYKKWTQSYDEFEK